MAGALQLIARLKAAPVPPVPPCKNSGEPLEAAPLLGVPPVPPVPPQKRNSQNQSTNPVRHISKVETDRWLARVASLLGCSPAYLLERGFIGPHDLAEQHRQHPSFAARLINSHPCWCQPNSESARNDTQCQKQHTVPEVTHLGASVRPPAWIASRDAFHAHAIGGCPDCHPPSGRYCGTGANLMEEYLAATEKQSGSIKRQGGTR